MNINDEIIDLLKIEREKLLAEMREEVRGDVARVMMRFPHGGTTPEDRAMITDVATHVVTETISGVSRMAAVMGDPFLSLLATYVAMTVLAPCIRDGQKELAEDIKAYVTAAGQRRGMQ